MHPMTWPSSVDNAVTMAYVSVGLIGAAALAAVASLASGDAGIQSGLFLLTVPCLVGLMYGARRLRRHGGRRTLVLSASLAAGVLVLTSIVGLVAYNDSAFVAFAAGPLVLVPLPVIAAALASSRDVGDWLSGNLAEPGR
jgi:sirohydrochlorin ferrochelatase